MHRTGKLFATTMIAAAGAVSAAVALSASAAAQPAPAPAPGPAPQVPGLPFLQQLAANPDAATQLMQGFANLMGNAPAAAAPVATAVTSPAPSATASITLPQPANVLPGADVLPGATALPGGNITTVPAANTTTVPAAAPTQNPISALTDSLGVPGGLASLLPSGTPLAGLLPTDSTAATAPVAAPAAAPAPAPASVFSPLSALP